MATRLCNSFFTEAVRILNTHLDDSRPFPTLILEPSSLHTFTFKLQHNCTVWNVICPHCCIQFHVPKLHTSVMCTGPLFLLASYHTLQITGTFSLQESTSSSNKNIVIAKAVALFFDWMTQNTKLEAWSNSLLSTNTLWFHDLDGDFIKLCTQLTVRAWYRTMGYAGSSVI